ncbi:unnamed protein product [Linum tenue]|uniref:RING-type E3 ubiquitin transferase n=2 Tax=Linum tenue TaxID=586396 RepID=A0AAV0I5J9_9ROSI|nr:unnamed protein product [Linum tenue]
MGSDATEHEEVPLQFHSYKVHHLMCAQLMKLVERIRGIFPQIEASRPRCSSGIRALVSLGCALERANQLLQYCSESSKLYLAMTGEAIVARFLRSRKQLEQSLGQIQTMVPVTLATELSPILDDLEAANFVMDPSEEEAGKVMLKLLHHGTDSAESQIIVFRVALSKLRITSQRDIVIEMRSIKKLLDTVGDSSPNKTEILRTLFYLLKKYKNLVSMKHRKGYHEGTTPITDNINDGQGNPGVGNPGEDARQPEILSTDAAGPPEEFRCPISRRVMYDPVIIASGQTYERMWIQKWFDEGNNTCPRTKSKLENCFMIPNTGMKALILKWCINYGITITDPTTQPLQSLDLSSDSITSLSSSMNDIVQLDISSLSLGSLEASYSYDAIEHSRSKLMPEHDSLSKCEYHAKMCDKEVEVLSQLSELPWDSQCKIIQDISSRLKICECQVWDSESSRLFIEPLLIHLRDALERCDIPAQKNGSKLFLALVDKSGSGASHLQEDAYSLLASFLDSEVIDETVAILDRLSAHQNCRSKIEASGGIDFLLKIFDCERKELQEQVIRILCNLSSSSSDVCSKLASLECCIIPKLVPFIKESSVARHCILLLKNLCDTEEARVTVAETNGCISSIAELLESESGEEQEHAVTVLLSLCSQRVQYCHLLMEESVISNLFSISLNGNDKAKVSALELLRQFRDVEPCERTELESSSLPPHCLDDTAAHVEVVSPHDRGRKQGFFRSLAGSLTSKKKG